VSAWPLLCASARRITSSLSSITLAVPLEDDQKRLIQVRPKRFPRPGAQSPNVSGSVWFTYGMVELSFTAELVVSMAADPKGVQIGKSAWVSAMQAEDGALAAWMRTGRLDDPFDIQTILDSAPFLSVTWPPNDLPRVQLRPAALFSEGHGVGRLKRRSPSVFWARRPLFCRRR